MHDSRVLQVVADNASKAAALYRRRCWWISFDDIRQEAVTAQLEALKKETFDASWKRSIAAYLWTVAVYSVRRAVHKASAPVSASHRTDKLIGLYRASLEESADPSYRVVMVDVAPLPDEVFEKKVRDGRVRDRVVQLVGEESAEFALGVITDEWKPREVAEAHGVPVQSVYSAQRQLVSILSGDRVLHELWRDL